MCTEIVSSFVPHYSDLVGWTDRRLVANDQDDCGVLVDCCHGVQYKRLPPNCHKLQATDVSPISKQESINSYLEVDLVLHQP